MSPSWWPAWPISTGTPARIDRSASRLGRAEGVLLQQPAAVRMQARHLGRRIDLEAARQALGDEGGHIGLGEAAQQQVVPLDHRLDGGQRLLHLRHAVVDPGLMHLFRRMVIALVGGVQALVAGAHHQRRHAQHGAPVGAGRRRQRAFVADDLVEVVDDGGAVDQGLAIVEDQGRDAAQRIGGAYLGSVAEARQVALLEGQAVGLECDGNPARVRRTIDSDQQHRHPLSSRPPTPEIVTCRYRLRRRSRRVTGAIASQVWDSRAIQRKPMSIEPVQSAALLSLGHAVPSHRLLQSDAAAAARRIFAHRYAAFERMAPVFETAGIRTRYTVKPLDWYFSDLDWPERNAAYLAGAQDLFIAAGTGQCAA